MMKLYYGVNYCVPAAAILEKWAFHMFMFIVSVLIQSSPSLRSWLGTLNIMSIYIFYQVDGLTVSDFIIGKDSWKNLNGHRA